MNIQCDRASTVYVEPMCFHFISVVFLLLLASALGMNSILFAGVSVDDNTIVFLDNGNDLDMQSSLNHLYPKLEEYDLNSDQIESLFYLNKLWNEIPSDDLEQILSSVFVKYDKLKFENEYYHRPLSKDQIRIIVRHRSMIPILLRRVVKPHFEQDFVYTNNQGLHRYAYPDVMYGLFYGVLRLQNYAAYDKRLDVSGVFPEWQNYGEEIQNRLSIALHYYVNYVQLFSYANSSSFYQYPFNATLMDLRIGFDVLYEHLYVDLFRRMKHFFARMTEYTSGRRINDRQIRYFVHTILDSEYGVAPRVDARYDFLNPIVDHLSPSLQKLSVKDQKSLVLWLFLARFLGLHDIEDSEIVEQYSEISLEDVSVVMREMSSYFVSLPGGYED